MAGGVRRVEAALRPWNKLLRLFLHLVGVRYGSGEGLVCCILAGSGDSLEALDLLGEFFCPFLVFFGDGIAVDANSGKVPLQLLGRSYYPFGCFVVWCFRVAGGACGDKS
ncbi:hypothetical protein C2845_PM16G03640 [Panicum miliaceum]|uniref:Uncharacterized protein n=1 Tax=Panicum miliaceum TaxID=4540 RepID=A0A3L6PXI9_PANMI|nr:hypothetical protein C2845_PM16G03640 [Panicum miliaceum]